MHEPGEAENLKKSRHNLNKSFMKKFRITLMAGSFAIALMAAFAFSPSYNTVKYFRVNPDGSRGAEITGEFQCTPSKNNCEYTVTYDDQGHEISSVLVKGDLEILE
jgi:hypothetical protein